MRLSRAVLLIAPVLLLLASGASASRIGLLPLAPPNLDPFGCVYIPDPDTNVSFPCGDFTPALVDIMVRIQASVSDPDGDPLTVTFYFDYLTPNADPNLPPDVNPDSPVRVVSLAPPAGVPEVAEANWTYPALGNWTTGIENESFYWIFIEARDVNGETASNLFPLYVNLNSPPVMDGLSNPYPVSPAIRFPDPVIPRVFADILVWDNDNDPLTVVWHWGDGTIDVNYTDPARDPITVVAVHQYDAALFPLNETPRIVTFDLVIWVHDGLPGHNTSFGPFAIQFDVDQDFPPATPTIQSPTVGSRWKVGDVIEFRGRATDPEGQPIEAYFWDFDNRTDSDGDGDPAFDRDALGNETTHAYAVPGNYTATLWATDGADKKVCFDETCSLNVTHWVRARIPLIVQNNRPPAVAISPQVVSADSLAFLIATVLDPDGDSMTLTWEFEDDGSVATNVTGALRPAGEPITGPYPPTGVGEAHQYAVAGIFNVTVRVSDGELEVSATTQIIVESFNAPPEISNATLFREVRDEANNTVLELARNGTFLVGEPVVIVVEASDFEGDPIEFQVDWTDGNVSAVRVEIVNGSLVVTPLSDGGSITCRLGTAPGSSACTFRHAYDAVGTYTVLVTVTDHRRTATYNATSGQVEDIRSHLVLGPPLTVIVAVPPGLAGLGPWDLWDYSTLSVLLGVPAFFLGRAMWRSYKLRKEE